MATHLSPSSMLKESLDESLAAAKFCCDYRKLDEQWKPFNTGGCLGFPGALLMFSVIDSIGSYFRKNDSFKIIIDGKEEGIDGDAWENFKILNSKYFKQHLSGEYLRALYQDYRSRLAHNSVLGKRANMIMNNQQILNFKITGEPFFKVHKYTGGNILDAYIISLKELHEMCTIAVEEFKRDIDDIVPFSKVEKKFH